MLDHLNTAVLAAGSSGIFDLVTQLTAQARTVVLSVAGLVAVLFILIRAWSARGAVAAIVMAALAAAVFLWLIANVTSVKDRVGTDINGLRGPGVGRVERSVATCRSVSGCVVTTSASCVIPGEGVGRLVVSSETAALGVLRPMGRGDRVSS